MTSQPTPARIYLATGALYLFIFCFGLYSEVVVRARLLVPGDVEATAQNILASPWLFKSAFASDLAVFACDVAVAVLLYVLLRPAGRAGSMLAAAFRLTGTAIYGVNLLLYFAALLLLINSGVLAAFQQGQLQAMAFLFLELHKHGYDLGLVFFGVHCLVVGWLLVRSAAFPTILGLLMALAGAVYLAGSLTRFLWPQYVAMVAPIYVLPVAGELSFSVWLLVKGLRMRRAG